MINEVGILHYVLGFALGHICGSVPSGLWLVQALHGIDIRNYGSKNIGTTNVFRTVGPTTAVMVLLCDMLKGIIAVALVNHFFHNPELDVVTALGALLGHNYSLFLGFKGGKGVATAFGALLAVNWMLGLSALAVVAVGLAVTQRMSVGSILGAAAFPVLCWFIEPNFIWIGLVMALIVLIKHRANIERLLKGEEPKMSFKK